MAQWDDKQLISVSSVDTRSGVHSALEAKEDDPIRRLRSFSLGSSRAMSRMFLPVIDLLLDT